MEPARCLMGRLRVSLRASGLPFFSPTREAGAGMCVASQAFEGRGAPPCAGCWRGPGPGPGGAVGGHLLAGPPGAASPKSGLHLSRRRGNVSSGSSLCLTASAPQAWKVRRSRKRGAITKKYCACEGRRHKPEEKQSRFLLIIG